jgi:hypothetical protein
VRWDFFFTGIIHMPEAVRFMKIQLAKMNSGEAL